MAFRIITAAALIACSATVAAAQDQPAAPAAKPAAKPASAAPADASAAPAAPQSANATPNLSGPQPDWIKVCSSDPQTKKDICQISRDLRADTGQTLASVAIREIKGGKRNLVMAIPPGMQIQPGVRVFIDKTQAAAGKFSVCLQNACFVEAELPDATLASMRKGTTLNLQALNVQGKGVVLPVALAGFAKAYDGPALDPKAMAADQQRLKDQLIERAKKAQSEQAAPAQ